MPNTKEALIKYCFERDRLQAVRNIEQMNPALAAEGLDFDLIRVSLSAKCPLLTAVFYNQIFAMSVATLQDKLTASGARLGNYRGAETPASFGDTKAEFAALLDGCAVFDLSWQAKLIFSGRDRVRWLNGMVTNNVRDLALGQGVYSFILTPQGHNQGDLVAYNRGDYLLAATDREQAPKITALLQRYIIMDDVEIEDISDKLGAIGVAGPMASETLSSAGIDVSQLQAGQVIDMVWREIGISVARNTHPQMDGYEIWLAAEQADRVWDALTSVGAVPVGSDALEMYRIARGGPRYRIDLRERDLAQETGQEHALSFTKGCYIGQEIWSAFAPAAMCIARLSGLKCRASRRNPERKFAPTTKMWARSRVRRVCRFPAATGRWPSAICGEKLQLLGRRCKLAIRAPR